MSKTIQPKGSPGHEQNKDSFAVVGGITRMVDAGLTVDTSAYVSGDVVGSLLAIPVSARQRGGSGYIQSVLVNDADGQSVDLDIFFFSGEVSVQADNDAWTPTIADLNKMVGKVKVQAWDTYNSIDNHTQEYLGIPYRLEEGVENLQMLVVARGAATFTASKNLVVKVGLLLD